MDMKLWSWLIGNNFKEFGIFGLHKEKEYLNILKNNNIMEILLIIKQMDMEYFVDKHIFIKDIG